MKSLILFILCLTYAQAVHYTLKPGQPLRIQLSATDPSATFMADFTDIHETSVCATIQYFPTSQMSPIFMNKTTCRPSSLNHINTGTLRCKSAAGIETCLLDGYVTQFYTRPVSLCGSSWDSSWPLDRRLNPWAYNTLRVNYEPDSLGTIVDFTVAITKLDQSGNACKLAEGKTFYGNVTDVSYLTTTVNFRNATTGEPLSLFSDTSLSQLGSDLARQSNIHIGWFPPVAFMKLNGSKGEAVFMIPTVIASDFDKLHRVLSKTYWVVGANGYFVYEGVVNVTAVSASIPARFHVASHSRLMLE